MLESLELAERASLVELDNIEDTPQDSDQLDGNGGNDETVQFQSEENDFVEIHSLRREIGSLGSVRLSQGLSTVDDLESVKRHSSRLSVLLHDDQKRLSNMWSQIIDSEAANASLN